METIEFDVFSILRKICFTASLTNDGIVFLVTQLRNRHKIVCHFWNVVLFGAFLNNTVTVQRQFVFIWEIRELFIGWFHLCLGDEVNFVHLQYMDQID